MTRFQRLTMRHRLWLKRRHLLDRPWFILCSAPNPNIPAGLPNDTAYIHVKYAGHSARAAGLPAGDLTFLLNKTQPEQVQSLEFPNILRLRSQHTKTTALKSLTPFLPYREYEILKPERDLLFTGVLGSYFDDFGDEKRPSNGIAIVCYALAVGAPEIILAGMSLTTDGHAYNDRGRRRRHRQEDRAALQEIARHFSHVSTSEPQIAELTGLPLYREGSQTGGSFQTT